MCVQVKGNKKRGRGVDTQIKEESSTKETSNLYNLVLRKEKIKKVYDPLTHQVKIQIQICLPPTPHLFHYAIYVTWTRLPQHTKHTLCYLQVLYGAGLGVCLSITSYSSSIYILHYLIAYLGHLVKTSSVSFLAKEATTCLSCWYFSSSLFSVFM